MKKIFVNQKGLVVIENVKEPILQKKGSIIKTSYALISTGTELSTIRKIRFNNFPLIKKIIKSKKFRRTIYSRIISNISLKDKINLFFQYFHQKKNKNFTNPTNSLIPIGYSCSGIIKNTNLDIYEINDKVICAGANHAELIFCLKNLTCKIPKNVTLEEAAFTTIGAIALHGIHRAEIKPGEFIGVVGTGLIGLISIQLARLSGAQVFAIDLINKRLKLAKKLGADVIINPLYHDLKREVNKKTEGKSLDSIIICAASKSSRILEESIDIVREKGKVVMLGEFPINLNRSKLYYKELDLLISRSYGPGRYDPYYEVNGCDYPKDYLPWTEQRNFEFFLRLISEGKVNVKPLISGVYSISNVNKAYQCLEKDPVNNIAVLLRFTDEMNLYIKKQKQLNHKKTNKKLILGLIGCGSFAQRSHLPYLIKNLNCNIKGISTKHKSTARNCKIKYQPDYVTNNYKEILKDPEIQTIFIYTQHNTHAKFAIDALNSGKNVYCEKPMGITINECRQVYNAVKQTEKLYSIGFNRRYSPLIIKTKELLKKRNNPIMINYRISNSYISGSHWIFNPKVGGGPIVGEFCHFTDLILYLINSDPIELVAKGGNLSHNKIDCYDTCIVIVKFKNGSLANLFYSDLNGPDMPKERIEIFSGDSAIIIDDFIVMKTSGFNCGNIKLNEQDKGYEGELSHVIKSNLGLEKLQIDVNDAMKAMDLCFKTLESIKQNKRITFEGDISYI